MDPLLAYVVLGAATLTEPVTTSKLLEQQELTRVELNSRFAEMFRRHRRLAFMYRHDELFIEHWTPESAAAGYEFESYEICDGRILLHGRQSVPQFTYHISIEFPLDLVDDTDAIDEFLTRQFEAKPCA